jgi:hypothetical protein
MPGVVEPTPLLLFGSLGFVLLGLWLGRYVPDIWRAGRAYDRIKRHFHDTYGGIQGTAFAASLPVCSAMLAFGGLVGLSGFAFEISTGQVRSAMDAASSVIIPAFMLLLVLWFAVVLFGRPKAVIPPHLRSHGGIVFAFVRWAARKRTRGA